MALLSAHDEQALTTRLAAIDRPVTLVLFTQTIGGTQSHYVARQVLGEIARLSPHVTVAEKSFVLDADDRARYGVEQAPAIVVLSQDHDTRMRFYGAPTGYEFMALVDAILIAGTGEAALDAATRQRLDGVTTPLHLRVFSTPTCPHCPRAVTLAHKLAFTFPNITADAVDATEFIELSRKFQVNGVPKVVVNDSIEMLGALPEAAFVDTMLGVEPTDGPAPSA